MTIFPLPLKPTEGLNGQPGKEEMSGITSGFEA